MNVEVGKLTTKTTMGHVETIRTINDMIAAGQALIQEGADGESEVSFHWANGIVIDTTYTEHVDDHN